MRPTIAVQHGGKKSLDTIQSGLKWELLTSATERNRTSSAMPNALILSNSTCPRQNSASMSQHLLHSKCKDCKYHLSWHIGIEGNMCTNMQNCTYALSFILDHSWIEVLTAMILVGSCSIKMCVSSLLEPTRDANTEQSCKLTSQKREGKAV